MSLERGREARSSRTLPAIKRFELYSEGTGNWHDQIPILKGFSCCTLENEMSGETRLGTGGCRLCETMVTATMASRLEIKTRVTFELCGTKNQQVWLINPLYWERQWLKIALGFLTQASGQYSLTHRADITEGTVSLWRGLVCLVLQMQSLGSCENHQGTYRYAVWMPESRAQQWSLG